MQMFFLTPTRNIFWLCCTSMFFIMLRELFFVKWVKLFERNFIVKWVIFFASFCWLWDCLPENLKIIDKLQIWGFDNLFPGPNFIFLALFSGILASVNLKGFKCLLLQNLLGYYIVLFKRTKTNIHCSTARNTAISSNFLVMKFWKRYSFHIDSG